MLDSPGFDFDATPPEAADIPAELRELPQWVLWCVKLRDGRATKIPCQLNGSQARTNDAATWSDFHSVCRRLNIDRAYSLNRYGIGFVFSPTDPYVGIDLDHCLNPDGTLADWAQPILELIGPTYAEVSPSGTGIKLWTRGSLPTEKTGGRKFTLDGQRLPEGAAIELYQHERYFAVTGNRWADSPSEVRDCSTAVASLWARITIEPEGKHKPGSNGQSGHATAAGGAGPQSVSLDDDAILAKARGSKGGEEFARLWAGDTSGHGSHSEADQALANRLAFWTGGDADRIDQLFRRSGLMRDKWADRDDYRDATISKAIEGCGGVFFEPKGQRRKRKQRAAARALAERSKQAADAAGAEPNKQPATLRPLTDPDGRTDSANAARLVARYGADLRWCEPWECWLVWDGRRWARDQERRAESMAKSVAASLWASVADLGNSPDVDDGDMQTMMAFAKLSNNAAGIRNMLALAKSEPGVPILPEVLDVDPWLLNVANGTLDLRTKELRPHNQADRLTKLCPVTFDPAATCPAWLAFLDTITAGNADLQSFLQRGVGYSLTGVIRDHALMFCYGTGSNGKSTFVSAVLGMLGEDYSLKAAPDLLLTKSSEAHPTERADLHGRRFIACVEAGEGRRMAESMVKELTGGDKVRARRMRENFWEFKASHKVWLAANHKPIIRGTDHGIWRRVKLVPFVVCIPDEKQDKTLGEKLSAEAAGILNWALDGCIAWQEKGLAEPQEVAKATAGYRTEMDILGGFIEECCVFSNMNKAKSSDLYAAYFNWCQKSGERPVTRTAFGTAMNERGFQKHTSNGVWYIGVGIVAKDKTEGLEGSEGLSYVHPPQARAYGELNRKKGPNSSNPSNDRKQAASGDQDDPDDRDWFSGIGPSTEWN